MFKTKYDFIRKLIGLQEIEIISANVNNGIFQVFASSSHSFAICPRCKKITQEVHDSRWQTIKHLPIWGTPTEIILQKKRFICNCSRNHPFDEQFEFLRKYQRQTVPFERIYNHCASALLEAREPEPLRLLGIDDIARKKGHNYNTVIYNQETGNVAAIFTGRRKKDGIDYLRGWPEDVRLKVEAVSLDMSRSYCQSTL